MSFTHVREAGTSYSIYVQNDYYFEQKNKIVTAEGFKDILDGTIASEQKQKELQQEIGYDANKNPYEELDSYYNKLIASIPQLKGVSVGDISIHLLPSAQDNTGDIDTQKLTVDSKDEKSASTLLGMVSCNYINEGDYQWGASELTILNDTSTYNSNQAELKIIEEKFIKAYAKDGADISKYSNLIAEEFEQFDRMERDRGSQYAGISQKKRIEELLEELKHKTQDSLMGNSSSYSTNVSLASVLQKSDKQLD